jgi:nicotinamide riboside kinase
MRLELPQKLPRNGDGLLLLPLGPSTTIDQKIYAMYFAALFCQRLTVVAGDFEPFPEVLEDAIKQAAAAVSAETEVDICVDIDINIDFGLTDLPRCDFVFGCRADAAQIAKNFGGQFIPVNIDGEIDGEGMAMLFSAVEKNLPRRICILGPESTGKSTLAKNLAGAFGATLVPEYAREHITYRNTDGHGTDKHSPLTGADLELIARGQFVSQSILAGAEKNILIADSDLLTTSLYAETLFGHCPGWIEELSGDPSQIFDLYLLTSPDVPWVDDAHRVDREGRAKFFEGCQQKLIAKGLAYVLIGGDWQSRFKQSVDAVTTLT